MVARDLVCGKQFETDDAPVEVVYRGRTYYFCSHACKVDFEREPTKYAAP